MNNWPVGILIVVAFVAGGLLIAIIWWLVRRQSKGLWRLQILVTI